MTSILRKLSLASAIVAAAVFTAAPALAETSVTVPFSFIAAGKLCPAGHYRVGRNPLSGVITLKSENNATSFAWVGGPGEPSPTDHRVILKFDKHGRMHYLHTIQYGPGITQELDSKAPDYQPSRLSRGQ